jgi:hypothetical protein
VEGECTGAPETAVGSKFPVYRPWPIHSHTKPRAPGVNSGGLGVMVYPSTGGAGPPDRLGRLRIVPPLHWLARQTDTVEHPSLTEIRLK